MGRNSDREPKNKLSGYLKYSGAGLSLVIAAGLGALLGWWIDGFTGSSPLFLVLGLFLGFGAGIYSLYQSLFGGKK